MQRSGTEAIRTQIQSTKPKRETTNITNSRNTKRTYGQPSEQSSEVGDQSKTGRRPVAEYLQLESVAICLLNMHTRRAATDVGREGFSAVAIKSVPNWLQRGRSAYVSKA